MVGYVEEYVKKYEKLASIAAEYAQADRASVADPLYEEYELLSADLAALDEYMTDTWNHILDTKYFSMAYILEKSHRYDILDRQLLAVNSLHYKQKRHNFSYRSRRQGDICVHFIQDFACLSFN